MKKPPPVALLCAGNLTDSAITRFRGLRGRLGPIKSSSLRLASRFANILRAGRPVDDYAAFEECSVVLLALPDAQVEAAIGELSNAGLDWSRLTVALCSADLDCAQLNPLAALGAESASICEAPGFEGRLFILEGDRPAIAQVRSLVESRNSRIVPVPRGQKMFYLAAAACSGPLFTGLLCCAGECLKLAGIASADAAGILHTQADRTVRSFIKGSRKRIPPVAGLDRQLAALRLAHPALADFLEQTAKLASRVSTK